MDGHYPGHDIDTFYLPGNVMSFCREKNAPHSRVMHRAPGTCRIGGKKLIICQSQAISSRVIC